MAVCSIPQEVRASIPDSKLTVGVGEGVPLTALFTTDGSGASCTHALNFAVQPVGGLPASFGSVSPASEDTEYTETWTPSSKGQFYLYATLAWNTEDPPVPPVPPPLVSPFLFVTVTAARKDALAADVPPREVTAKRPARKAESDSPDREATATATVREKRSEKQEP